MRLLWVKWDDAGGILSTVTDPGQVLPDAGEELHLIQLSESSTTRHTHIYCLCDLNPHPVSLAIPMLLKSVPIEHSCALPQGKLASWPHPKVIWKTLQVLPALWGSSMPTSRHLHLLPIPSLLIFWQMVKSQRLKPLWERFSQLLCEPQSSQQQQHLSTN